LQHAVSMDTAERTSAPMLTSDRQGFHYLIQQKGALKQTTKVGLSPSGEARQVDRSVVRSARNGEEIYIYIYEVEVIYVLYI
jgi:hypothetical protein